MIYRALATGLNTRKLIPFDENYYENVQKVINKNPDKDYYESIYVYEDRHVERFEQTKSLAGIKDVKTDRAVFDFDDADLSLAQADAIEVIKRLNEASVPTSAIRVFFSGNKGFHVEVHFQEGQNISRKEFERIIKNFASDLKTFDTKVKDEQRILRIPFTRHAESKLFKIPLSVGEINNLKVEDIVEKAKEENLDSVQVPEWTTIDCAVLLELDPPEAQIQPPLDEIGALPEKKQDGPDMSRKPRHLTAAKYVLQEGFFEEGERNEACLILAATYKYLGYHKDHAYNMLKATLRLRAARLGLPDYDRDELWRTVVEPVYSPTWQGGTFSEDEGLLAKTIKRYGLNKTGVTDNGLISLDNLSSAFEDFAMNIDNNTIKLGIKPVDDNVRITTSMLVSFLAAPGSGKSSIAMGIMNELSNRNEKSIFFSLDMGYPQVFQRLLQKHTGDDSDTILNAYKTLDKARVKKYNDVLRKEYKNVRFCFKSGLTVELIRDYLIYERDVTGVMPKLIVVDYLECVKSPFSDPTQSKAFVASSLKDIANEFGICVFLLVQPTKQSGDPSAELNSYMNIKGSGVIAEASSVVLTLYRPGFNPRDNSDDKYATITVVKNRMGPLSSTDLIWDGPTGNVRQMTSDEENDLEQLRENIAQRRAAEQSERTLF